MIIISYELLAKLPIEIIKKILYNKFFMETYCDIIFEIDIQCRQEVIIFISKYRRWACAMLLCKWNCHVSLWTMLFITYIVSLWNFKMDAMTNNYNVIWQSAIKFIMFNINDILIKSLYSQLMFPMCHMILNTTLLIHWYISMNFQLKCQYCLRLLTWVVSSLS